MYERTAYSQLHATSWDWGISPRRTSEFKYNFTIEFAASGSVAARGK